MFEIGKMYISTDGEYVRNLRVDYIQYVKGVPEVAIGVANAGDPDELWDFEGMDDFEKYGWREL